MAKGKKKGKGILESGTGWPVFGVGAHNTGPDAGWGNADMMPTGPGDTGPAGSHGGSDFNPGMSASLGGSARMVSQKPTPTKPTKPSKPTKPVKKKGK